MKKCDNCLLGNAPALFKENYDAWDLFEASNTQVRVSFGGIIGLDYSAVKLLATSLEIKMNEIMWRKIKALEITMVNKASNELDKEIKK